MQPKSYSLTDLRSNTVVGRWVKFENGMIEAVTRLIKSGTGPVTITWDPNKSAEISQGKTKIYSLTPFVPQNLVAAIQQERKKWILPGRPSVSGWHRTKALAKAFDNCEESRFALAFTDEYGTQVGEVLILDKQWHAFEQSALKCGYSNHEHLRMPFAETFFPSLPHDGFVFYCVHGKSLFAAHLPANFKPPQPGKQLAEVLRRQKLRASY